SLRRRRQELLRTDDQKPRTRPVGRFLVFQRAIHAATARRTPRQPRSDAATLLATHTTQKPRRTRPQLLNLRNRPNLGLPRTPPPLRRLRSEEHTSELQSRFDLVCRLLLEKKNDAYTQTTAYRSL